MQRSVAAGSFHDIIIVIKRAFPFLALAYLPLALTDIRLPLPGLDVRVSDFYLLMLLGVFIGFHASAVGWILHCLAFFIPFLVYVAISSLLMGNRSGIVELIQWGLVLTWIPVLSFVLRNNDYRHLKFLIYCLLALTLYVAVQHVSMGYPVGYKKMGDAKYAFGLFALISALYFIHFKNGKNFMLLLVALVLLMLSLERKGILISAVAFTFGLPLVFMRVSSTATALFLWVVQAAAATFAFIMYFFVIREKTSVTYYLDENAALWNSNLHRENLIANGVEIFLNHPWLGVGAKALDDHMEQFYLDPALALYTHNWYLDLFVEYGLVGALLFFSAVTATIFRLSTRAQNVGVVVPLAIYCMTVPVFMANGTTTTIIYMTALACFVATGSAVSMAKLSDQKVNQREQA